MKVRTILACAVAAMVIYLLGGCTGSNSTDARSHANKTTFRIISSITAISTDTEDQQNPQVIYLPDRKIYFTVWEDWRNRLTTGADIYGQFINPDGTKCSNP